MRIRDVLELTRPNHLIGNALLYTLGAVIALKIYAPSNNYFIGLASFIIAYGCVYLFNDLMDIEHDKNHEVEWKRKRPLPDGRISVNFARAYLTILITISLALSLLINTQFMILNTSIILMNFTYSKFKLKNKQVIGMIIISAIQALKLLLGWTSIATNYTQTPIIFFIMYGLAYTFTLSVYKKNKFRNEKEYKNYMKVTGITTIILFLTSIIIYPVIKNSVLNVIITLLLGAPILLKLKDNINKNFTKGLYTSTIIIALIVISFLIN